MFERFTRFAGNAVIWTDRDWEIDDIDWEIDDIDWEIDDIDWEIDDIDWEIDWVIDWLMHITVGYDLSEFMFSSYNILWLHHLITSSVYIIPLRYRRSSPTATVLPFVLYGLIRYVREIEIEIERLIHERLIDWLIDLILIDVV